MLVPTLRKPISKKQGKSIRSSVELPIRVLYLKKEQVSIDSILYNRVEKLRRTSVNKSPTYRRISIDIVGLWFKMNKYRVFQSFFLQKFYLLSCCHRTYIELLFISGCYEISRKQCSILKIIGVNRWIVEIMMIHLMTSLDI